MERVLGRVEEGLAQAVERMPELVAQQVKGRFISRYGWCGWGLFSALCWLVEGA
jgi:hypothetical protein